MDSFCLPTRTNVFFSFFAKTLKGPMTNFYLSCRLLPPPPDRDVYHISQTPPLPCFKLSFPLISSVFSSRAISSFSASVANLDELCSIQIPPSSSSLSPPPSSSSFSLSPLILPPPSSSSACISLCPSFHSLRYELCATSSPHERIILADE